jgi:signal transduction histidine kinase
VSIPSNLQEAPDRARKRRRFAVFTRLRGRLLLLVFLAFVPLVALTLYNTADQRRQSAAHVHVDAMRMTDFVAREQENLVRDARGLIVALTQLAPVRNLDGPACSVIMSGILKEHVVYADLGAANVNGDVFCSAPPISGAANVADQSQFALAVQTKGFAVGEYAVSRVSQKPVLSVGYPILDDSREVTAVVFAAIDLRWLNELVAAQNLPEGSTVSIIDQSGIVLARYPDPERWIGAVVPASTLELVLSQGEGVSEGVGIDGVQRLYAFKSVCCTSAGRLYVRVGFPDDIAYAEVDRLMRRNLLALGLAMFVSLLLAWLLSGAFFVRPVKTLVRCTQQLKAGDLNARTGLADSAGELGELAWAFDSMAESLQVREAENKRMLASLRRERERGAQLLQGLIDAQESERKRIARDLHDETSQGLSALKLGLETAEVALASGDKEAGTRLRTAASLAENLLEDIQRLIEDLRPLLLDDLGLVPAIAWWGRQRLEPLGMEMDLSSTLKGARLPSTYEITLFRIAQEAINNIARHSSATRVTCNLRATGGEVVLRVEDNGRGFRMQPEDADIDNVVGNGLGLLGIRERTRMLGGKFSLTTAPGQGTVLEVRLPTIDGAADA